MILKCIKGIADSQNVNVVCLTNDEVKVLEVNEGEVLIEGILGWCTGYELSLTPKQIAENFSWKSEK